jgi:hypothetical protein
VSRISDSVHLAVRRAEADTKRERVFREFARKERVSWAQDITALYKLRSLAPHAREHTLGIIESSRVYFPSPLQFNDPFDCFPPFELAGDINDAEFVRELERDEAKMAAEAGISAEQIAEVRAREGVPVEKMAVAVRANTVLALREDTRVLCLGTEQRHPLMWSHYASSHSGNCLHFRCGPENLFGLSREVFSIAKSESPY